MAADKLVDSSRLDNALNATADAIRAKIGSGTDGDMTWDMDSGFSVPVGNIVTLVEGTDDGTVTANRILSGYVGYANGIRYEGNIHTLDSDELIVDGPTVTVPVRMFTGVSTATPISATVDSGDYSADSSSSTNSTVTPKVILTSSATSTYGFTKTKPSSGTYLTIDPDAEATNWSVTPRANITTAGYIVAGSKNGTAVTGSPSIGAGENYYVPIQSVSFGGGALSETTNKNTITTSPVVTAATSGTFTTKTGYGVTTTKPSGTDGTAYLTINSGASVTTTGKAKSEYAVSRANVTYSNSAGVIAAHDGTTATLSASDSKSGSKEVDITPETVNAAPYYIPIVSASFDGGGLTSTNYAKNDLALTLEDGSDKNVTNYTVGAKDTTNYPYYVKVNGSTPSVSGTTTVTRATVTYSNNAGAIAKHTDATASLSASSTASPTVNVNATSNSIYVGFKKATATVSGTNTVTPSASVAGNANVTLGTTDNGIAVTATGGGTASVTATAKTNTTGYAPASTTLGSATLSATSKTTTHTKYITGVVVPTDVPFSVTSTADTALDTTSDISIKNYGYRRAYTTNYENASAKVLSASNNNGSIVNVSAYATAESTGRTAKDIVTDGHWVNPAVTASGTYYGRVVVPAGTATNPATLPSEESFTQVDRGDYIKIGAGFYSEDAYYQAQPNSGTVTISGSGNTNCDGKTTVSVPAATPTFKGGGLTGGSTATGTSCTINTTANNGIKIQTKYTASRAAVQYDGAVNGWVTVSDSAEALASGNLSSTNGTLYYLTAVTTPKNVGFSVTTTADTALDTSSDLDVTNNAYRRVDCTNKANGTVLVANSGNTTVTSGSATAGNLTVSAYNSSGTAENNKSIVSAGKWVSTTASATGTYYGRVTVNSATTSISGGDLSGTATATGTNCVINSTNNSGVSIKTACTASRAKVTCSASTAGWVSGTIKELAAGSTAMTATTYYINGVTLTAGKTFTVTVPNGSANNTIDFVFRVDANNNVTVTEQ